MCTKNPGDQQDKKSAAVTHTNRNFSHCNKFFYI